MSAHYHLLLCRQSPGLLNNWAEDFVDLANIMKKRRGRDSFNFLLRASLLHVQ